MRSKRKSMHKDWKMMNTTEQLAKALAANCLADAALFSDINDVIARTEELTGESLRQQVAELTDLTIRLANEQESISSRVEYNHMAAKLAEANSEIDRLKQKLGNEVTFDGKTAFEFVGEELFNFQNATGCNTADEYQQQLVATQARVHRLLGVLAHCSAPFVNSATVQIAKWRVQEALAPTQDNAALEAMIAKAAEVMRERCVKACTDRSAETDADDFDEWDQSNYSCAEAIRALSGVTLEDLK